MEYRFNASVDLVERRAGTAQGDLPTITGYAAVFYDGTPGSEFELYDDVFERIAPGAFDDAIEEDDVRALFNHKPDYVLGRLSAGTLRLSVDRRGLRYEIDPPNTSAGRDAVESIRRGDVSGSSFSFDVQAQTFKIDAGRTVRQLDKVRLMDVGPVTFPAYKGASVSVAGGKGRSVSISPANAVRTLNRHVGCPTVPVELQGRLAAYRIQAQLVMKGL